MISSASGLVGSTDIRRQRIAHVLTHLQIAIWSNQQFQFSFCKFTMKQTIANGLEKPTERFLAQYKEKICRSDGTNVFGDVSRTN